MRFLLAFLLFPQLVMAASISGTVYDLGLDPVMDAVVLIDTTPEQRLVVKESTYRIQVPEGAYTLHALALIEDDEWIVTEEINVSQDGEYVLDLILAPSFSEEDDLFFEEELPDFDDEDESYVLYFLIGFITIASIAFLYGKNMSLSREESDDEYRNAVLKILKKHRGRVSQRDLRKEAPFSEAKVSLVLTELESEGKIKKIKKGRGNLIVSK